MRTTINLYYVNLQQKFPDKKPEDYIICINFTDSVKADGGGAGRSCPATRWWAWRVTPCRATAARPGWGGVAAATTPPTYCRSSLPTSRSAPVRGCSQMTSAFFGVSDTPWCLCQPIISFWPAPWCFKLTTSFVNHPEPKTIIFRIQFISIRDNRICVTKGVQLSLVRPTKACFGWIPSNR